MRIDRYQPPKSSFLSMEKDLGIIIGKMDECSRLKRLLCNNTRGALGQETPAIGIAEMIQKGYIRIVPKITIDEEVRQYVVISFDNFTPNATNPEFRDNIISFDIICHFDNWNLENLQLRPYKIAAELDSMFNGKYLSGIGTLQFLGANQIILTDEFGGLSLMYAAIHGEEDKNDYVTKVVPEQERQFVAEKFAAELANIDEDNKDNEFYNG